MRIRPEAEAKLRAGFQRRVDEQGDRYAAQLAHAGQLAARFGCGEVAGVFSGEAGGDVRPRTFVVGLLPLAALPLLIAATAARIPGVLPVLEVFPFAAGAWIGVSFWRGREPRRRVWFYAFAEGFMLLDDPRADVAPVRWSQVTSIEEVWTEVYRPGEEDPRPTLAAYRLRSADGRAHEISRSFRNVRDPYGEVGQLLRILAPGSIGKTMPRFPTIDEIIAAYARKPSVSLSSQPPARALGGLGAAGAGRVPVPPGALGTGPLAGTTARSDRHDLSNIIANGAISWQAYG